MSADTDGELLWGEQCGGDGRCPECEGPLLWGGMHWVPHTEEWHAVRRRSLMRAVRRQLWLEMSFRWDAFELAVLHGSVLVQWRVQLPHDIRYGRTVVPGEVWDLPDPDSLLATLGETLKDGIQAETGARPHHMHVKYRVFDER
jgi:hypothetical protein